MAKGIDKGMWMGIGNKAIYYDGYKAVQFIPDSANIYSLVFEKDTNLLVSTTNGIFRYKDGEFRKILNFRFNSQQNFITDLNGNVWIGCEYGLLKITPKTIFSLNPEGYFEIAANGSVLNTIKSEKANDYLLNSINEIRFPVYNLTINRAQKVWMTIDLPDKNLASIEIPRDSKNLPIWKYIQMPTLSISDVSAICEHDNSLWITSSNPNIMLLQYLISAEKWKSTDLKVFGGDNVQASILKTSDGNLWIGGHSKLYSLTEAGWKVYQYPEVSLPLAYIQIYADKQDNIFLFGANGSLMKLDLSSRSFGTFLGLNFNCNTPDGKYWFTTNVGEVVSCNQSMQNFQKYSVTDGLMTMAMSLHNSPKSGLWAAGSNHGKAAVARFEHGHWTMTTFPDLYLGILTNVFISQLKSG